jgi:hypothetical protein
MENSFKNGILLGQMDHRALGVIWDQPNTFFPHLLINTRQH